jgi:AcrR family transcriptional regulator
MVAVPSTGEEPAVVVPSEPIVVDGRTARAERTRTAIVDALLGLLDAGDLNPTAARIAERAGISQRLIYHHFGDLESLFRAVADRQGARVAEFYRPVDPALPFAERAAAFLDQRAAILEMATPVRRAALRHEHYSPQIQDTTRRVAAVARLELTTVFARELARVPGDRRPTLTTALNGVLGWGHWNDLRQSGLPVTDARAALQVVLLAVLGPFVRD